MSELNFPNLVLTIRQGKGTFTKDENGNPIEKTSDYIFYASVKKKSNPEFYKLPGISTTDLFLVGKIVSKSVWGDNWIGASLPDFVNLETEAQAVLTLGSHTQRGIFRFTPTTQSRIMSISQTFGERVNGYIRVTSRN
ncbi:hypothetical protein H6G91_17105 [Nostoc muscorum FACHB-395]|nr:hypothetical protein [Desmonostoc muscorum FACHB-395]